jgi:hypothetical protein
MAHVARDPDTQDVCPEVQLFLHVNEHVALGALPEHDWRDGHVVVDALYAQWSASTAQVTSVCWSWHTVPETVQTEELHAHEAEPIATTHFWFAPQVVVFTHCVQPFGWTSHV